MGELKEFNFWNISLTKNFYYNFGGIMRLIKRGKESHLVYTNQDEVEKSRKISGAKIVFQKMTPGLVGFEVSRFLLLIIKLFIAIGLSIVVNLYLQYSLFVDFKVDADILNYRPSVFWGAIVLLITFIFVWSLTGKFVLTTVYYSLIMGTLVFANNKKIELRLEPIFPEELKMLAQSKELLEFIDLKNLTMGINIFIMATLIVLIYYLIIKRVWLQKYMMKLGLRNFEVRHSLGRYVYFWGRILTIAFTGYLLMACYNFNKSPLISRVLKVEKGQYVVHSQWANYKISGFVTGFLYNMPVTPMASISDYSKDRMTKIELKYNEIAKRINEKRTSNFADTKVVYILSESLFNPSQLEMLELSQTPLPELEKIMSETSSGKMLSSDIGGGTTNIEYAALTSLALANFQPQISNAYNSFAYKQSESVTVLDFYKKNKSELNEVIAVHPYIPTFYKRREVFKNFGFDDFIFEGNLKFTDRHGGINITDESAYLETLDVLKNDNVGFIQLSTMQNHLPYGDGFSDRSVQKVTTSILEEEDMETLNKYIAGINATDEATKDFLDEIELIEDDVTVLLYGDHLPAFMSKYADVLSDLEKFGTDFFIYSNHGRNKVKKYPIVSPIFFTNMVAQQNDAKLSAYYAVLEELFKHVQAYDRENYYVEGISKKYEELDKETKILLEDYRLVQYDLTSGKGYLTDSFFDVQ